VRLAYRQRAGANGRSIKRKNAASGGTMCAAKNLVCVPNSRRRGTAEPRITILLSFLACSIDWASLPGAVEQAPLV
jgi:hypothetical protein